MIREWKKQKKCKHEWMIITNIQRVRAWPVLIFTYEKSQKALCLKCNKVEIP